jgi:hypothetical protein
MIGATSIKTLPDTVPTGRGTVGVVPEGFNHQNMVAYTSCNAGLRGRPQRGSAGTRVKRDGLQV